MRVDGLRRSEVSALRWADGDGVLVTVRRSKTNQEGEVNDVRYVKDGVARALRTLRGSHVPGAGRPGGAAVGADDRVAVHRRCAGRWASRAGSPRTQGGSG